MTKIRIFSLVFLGVSLGVLGMQIFNFGVVCARKWDAISWVMADRNEEIVYREMNRYTTVQKVVITKK